ncbi:hypothetical protein M8J77_021269 [Diaphorina citri]|nr:hypothetical protein M8J77_021269 [Diaphorina citri]
MATHPNIPTTPIVNISGMISATLEGQLFHELRFYQTLHQLSSFESPDQPENWIELAEDRDIAGDHKAECHNKSQHMICPNSHAFKY